MSSIVFIAVPVVRDMRVADHTGKDFVLTSADKLNQVIDE
jgi:hypothetical protein